MTFGFDSASPCATDAIRPLAHQAESHRRVIGAGSNGSYAGWIAVYAGLAAGPM